MKMSIILMLMLMWSALAVAQKLPYQRIDTLDKRPIMTVNGKITDPLSFFTLNKQDFQDLKWLNPEEAMKKFGKGDGKYGAIVIEMNPQAKFLTWDQLLKSFNFNKAPDQMRCLLRTTWDMYYINQPQLLLTSPLRIWSAGIQQGVYGDYANYAFQIHIRYDEDSKAEPSQFKELIKTITAIFEAEVSQRRKIESSKTVVRG